MSQDNGHEGTLKEKDYQYTGQILNDHPEGKGKLAYTNGNTYEGEFKDGNFDGKGTFTHGKDKWSYTGEFKQAKPDGEGTMTLADGKTEKVKFKKGVLVK